jgi:membrane-associated phospholipid phosphatase
MRFEFPRPSLPDRVTTLRPTPARAWAAQLMKELALHDWVVLVFNVALLLAALGGHGPLQASCVARTALSVAIVGVTLLLVKGGLLGQGKVSAVIHRLVVYGSVQLSYFTLHDLLPTATTRVLDERLYQIDRGLFGVEPTLWADRFVAPTTTEWFSFFYFSYFFVLGVHVLPMLFGTRRLRLLAEFALGIIGVVCIGELLYLVVPGYGPYRHLAGLYQNQLPSGFWYDLVQETVQKGGALLDIFPSLHTAGPAFIAMFSFRHRDERPFRYTWPVAAFFSLNIIGATIFLRWHYLIDILAGLALATFCAVASGKLTAWERARRSRVGALTPVWAPLWGAATDDPAHAAQRSRAS